MTRIGTRASGLSTTKWPFMFVTDAYGVGTDWMVLHAPIESSSRMDLYSDYRRRGFRFLGMSSFMTFPADTDSNALDYSAICQGWAHCFRDPDRFLPARQPRALLSLSDFADPALLNPARFSRCADDRTQPSFDYIYVGAERAWKRKAKNWSLAKRCLPRLSRELGLRGLVIGLDAESIKGLPGLTASQWLPYERFLQHLAASRFLFVPNEVDASPRVLAEALCLNVPLVVNRALLGGWKYVNDKTGEFFDDEWDVVDAVDRCLNTRSRPRTWYMNQYGPRQAGRILARLIHEIEPGCARTEPLSLSYNLRSCRGDVD